VKVDPGGACLAAINRHQLAVTSGPAPSATARLAASRATRVTVRRASADSRASA
jgi:hypothetical protein